MIDLMQWVKRESIRGIEMPFTDGQFDFATDGAAMIRVPASGNYGTHKITKQANEWFSKEREYQTLSVKMPKKVACHDCEGKGKASRKECRECKGKGEVFLNNDFHEYDCQCQSCGGDGEIITPGGDDDCENCSGKGKYWPRYTRVEFLGLHIDANYLAKIIDLPNLVVSADTGEQYLYFKSGDAVGVIKGMRQ